MKIQYASDLHLEFRDNAAFVRDNPLIPSGEILLLAGDIGYLGDDNFSIHPFWDWVSENYQQVLVVPGNHEFYKGYDLDTIKDGHIGTIRENVHWYYNAVVTIGDVEFILTTLWAYIDPLNAFWIERGVSDFKRIIKSKNTINYLDFNNEHKRALTFLNKALVKSKAKKHIVVSHHVPSNLLSSPEFKGSTINGAFVSELFDFIESKDIDYWIYGHSHRNINAEIGKTKCISNQLGYVSMENISSFDREKFIEL